jgi:hypothetical protein
MGMIGQEWIGIPYDGEKFCMELARRYLLRKGFRVPYVDSPDEAMGWIKVIAPEEDAVVVFRRYGRPSHVGVCLNSNDFLHVEENSSSCIDRLSSPIWNKRIEGFYRYVG